MACQRGYWVPYGFIDDSYLSVGGPCLHTRSALTKISRPPLLPLIADSALVMVILRISPAPKMLPRCRKMPRSRVSRRLTSPIQAISLPLARGLTKGPWISYMDMILCSLPIISAAPSGTSPNWWMTMRRIPLPSIRLPETVPLTQGQVPKR